MADDFPDLGEIAAILAATQGSISFERMRQACPNFMKSFNTNWLMAD